jgi:hypothetical protein
LQWPGESAAARRHSPLSPLQLHPLPAPSPSLPFPKTAYIFIFLSWLSWAEGTGHRVPLRAVFSFPPLQLLSCHSGSCTSVCPPPSRHLGSGHGPAASGGCSGDPLLHQPPFRHLTMYDDNDDDNDGRPWECISKDMDHPVRHWHWQCSLSGGSEAYYPGPGPSLPNCPTVCSTTVVTPPSLGLQGRPGQAVPVGTGPAWQCANKGT